jgi:hypothetical protein
MEDLLRAGSITGGRVGYFANTDLPMITKRCCDTAAINERVAALALSFQATSRF